jgi:hypothetical protein
MSRKAGDAEIHPRKPQQAHMRIGVFQYALCKEDQAIIADLSFPVVTFALNRIRSSE